MSCFQSSRSTCNAQLCATPAAVDPPSALQHHELTAAEQHSIHTCLSRQKHVAASNDAIDRSVIEWNQLRLPRLIVDYLLRCGHFEAARQLSQKRDCRELCDWPVFEAAQSIVTSLHQQDCEPALAWCAPSHIGLLSQTGSVGRLLTVRKQSRRSSH